VLAPIALFGLPLRGIAVLLADDTLFAAGSLVAAVSGAVVAGAFVLARGIATVRRRQADETAPAAGGVMKALAAGVAVFAPLAVNWGVENGL